MNFGLGVILLLVAVVLFVLAALSDTNWPELTASASRPSPARSSHRPSAGRDRTFGSSSQHERAQRDSSSANVSGGSAGGR